MNKTPSPWAWPQIAGGVLGGAIVLATVFGSILLATQEVSPPETPTATSALATMPAPSLTSVPSTAPETTPTPTAVCAYPAGWVAFTVRPGDTLSTIAQAVGTTEFLLIEGNCLVDTTLSAEQVVLVPPPPTPGPTVPPTPCGPPRGWVIYRVRPGDTLYSLSLRHMTTVQALALANCLTAYTLRADQPLYVPPTSRPTATPSPSLPVLPTDTPEASFTPTPTETVAPATASPTLTSDAPLPTATDTPLPTATDTPPLPDTPTPTWTPQPTDTLLPTGTPGPVLSATPSALTIHSAAPQSG